MSRPRRIDSSMPPPPEWYKDAILYELHVRAFADSNGDGVGDFRGLMQKLDYLQDLGVTALWLLPFYPSPLRDDGYDIADYTAVNSRFGTLGDFKTFLREAHSRGLRVITELVVNHTSDQHPWFQRARHSPPGSPERDFYVWSPTSDRYKEARIIFKDFEPSNWTWDEQAGAFYWHRFYSHQPDLNYDHPAVHDAIFRVLDFWLGMGIDGLRLDAVPYLYEREGSNCENLPETHGFLKKLRRHIDERFANRMLLAEANQWPEDAVAYFGAGDECQMAFHFPVMPRLFMSIRMEDRLPILDILQQTPAIPESCQWALFLRNHDELTLEMVTDEDRDYMYRVYAQDPQARINLGIRRRLAPLLENHRGKIELMNGLLFSLPGTPVIYYGDEIGMGDNIYLGDRNGVRTPMQWSPDRNAGFSRANPQRLYLPVIIDPAYHYEAVNVEAQQNSPHSLLWWMKRLIALRKRVKAFGRGSIQFLHPENHKVLAFLRRYGDECILVVANLSRFAQHADLDLAAFQGLIPVEMFGRTKFPAIGEHPYSFTLGPYAFYWLILEMPRVERLADGAQRPLPTIEVADSWEAVLRGDARSRLQELLPDYLQACRWFAGKARQTEAAMLLETIPFHVNGTGAYITLVQVEYTEGNAETYLLPLAYTHGDSAETLRTQLPESMICRLLLKRSAGTEEGFLYDPVGEKQFSLGLLDALVRSKRFRRAGGELRTLPQSGWKKFQAQFRPDWQPRLFHGEQANSSVYFDEAWMLKVYRRLEEGISPEVEVSRFLAERTTFTQVPALAGAFEYLRTWGEPVAIGVVQEFVPYRMDGWHFVRDILGRYFEQVLIRSEAPADLILPPRLPGHSAELQLPGLAQELLGPFLEPLRLLSRRTAEFHAALASHPEEPAFAPEPFTTLYQRSLYQSMRSNTRQAFESLRQRVKQLPEAQREMAFKVLSREEDVIRRAATILERKVQAQRSRCHDDYHLGHVLYTGKDFVIIDLEGQAARSLAERRRKRSPLRDVASMLRSFQNAVCYTMQSEAIRREDKPALEPWARFWEGWVAAVFVKEYLTTASASPLVPSSDTEIWLLLDFYLLKRAVAELWDELARPAGRLPMVLEGLVQLMERGALADGR